MTFYHLVCNCAHNSFRHLNGRWCSLGSYTDTSLTTMTMALWRLDILKWKCESLAYVIYQFTQSSSWSSRAAFIFPFHFVWYSMAPQYNVTMNILFIFSSLVHSFIRLLIPSLTNKAQMELLKRSIFPSLFAMRIEEGNEPNLCSLRLNGNRYQV